MRVTTVGDLIQVLAQLNPNDPLDITVEVYSIKQELGLRVLCDTYDIIESESDIILALCGDWNI